MLEGDGCDYFILRAGVQATKEAPPEAMTIEIGVRRGGGTAVIWNEMEKMKQKRLHICVDPYGDLPLPVGDQGHRQVYDYGDWMRRQALRDVFAVADEEKLDVLFFLLEDTEFFSRFRDGIPWYGSGKKEMRREYCLAYLDGPHSADAVHSELLFFLPRMREFYTCF